MVSSDENNSTSSLLAEPHGSSYCAVNNLVKKKKIAVCVVMTMTLQKINNKKIRGILCKSLHNLPTFSTNAFIAQTAKIRRQRAPLSLPNNYFSLYFKFSNFPPSSDWFHHLWAKFCCDEKHARVISFNLRYCFWNVTFSTCEAFLLKCSAIIITICASKNISSTQN